MNSINQHTECPQDGERASSSSHRDNSGGGVAGNTVPSNGDPFAAVFGLKIWDFYAGHSLQGILAMNGREKLSVAEICQQAAIVADTMMRLRKFGA